MDTAKRERWITVLRSGDYSQARGILRDRKKAMCCLGVGINEFCPRNWGDDRGMAVDKINGSADYPSYDSLAAIGITEAEAHTLAEFNDEYGLSFVEIANHLERNPDNFDIEFNDEDREANGRSNRT